LAVSEPTWRMSLRARLAERGNLVDAPAQKTPCEAGPVELALADVDDDLDAAVLGLAGSGSVGGHGPGRTAA